MFRIYIVWVLTFISSRIGVNMKFAIFAIVCVVVSAMTLGCAHDSKAQPKPNGMNAPASKELIAEVYIQGKTLYLRQQIYVPGTILIDTEPEQKYDTLLPQKPTTREFKQEVRLHSDPVLTKANSKLLAEIWIAGGRSDCVSATCSQPGHIILHFPYEKGDVKEKIIQYSEALFTPLDF